MSITFRDAEPADSDVLATLSNELGHAIGEAALRSNLVALAGLDLKPIVAVAGNTVIGMCAISIMQTLHRETLVGRISTMIVTERHRGQGIGALLVAEAERRLKVRGCRLIEVTSNERLASAHAFYQHLGYSRTSLRFAKQV